MVAYTRSTSPNNEASNGKPRYHSALIVGTGPGLSASLARLFTREGLKVAVAARQTDKLADLARETGAAVHQCNAADAADVARLFEAVEAAGGAPDIVVYNASARVRGALVDLPTDEVKRAIEVSVFGAFWSRSRRQGACCPRSTAPSS